MGSPDDDKMDPAIKILLAYVIVFLILLVVTSVMFAMYDDTHNVVLLIIGICTSSILFLMVAVPLGAQAYDKYKESK